MILGEPLVQISRMIDSLEPPQTLYEGITPLLARYSNKKHYCDITDLPKSLLTSAKEVRLLRLGAEASYLEPPGRFEAETNGLGIKIATKEVPWQDVCDEITPEGHVAIQDEDAQMMATVFSWRSDHSFISVPPPDLTKRANTKQIDVRIWDQLFELHVPQYVPDEIHQVEGAAERIPPSQQQYLDPRTVRERAFFGHPTAEQLAAIREEEEEEESTERDEGEDEREGGGESNEVLGEEDETPEEGSYSEHSEGEQSEEEEEDDEGEEENEEESAGSEWEAVPEEALRTSTEEEDPEATRKREEIATGKKELELASAASLQICDDPN
ncbi:hypothetical protein CBR_g664 [Chara braunii]|uniref:Uncharacterized protein n=1 Tax=Chara braunii TaxID=69332 RepID=A0A388KC61_CHABU|nr:hypothetical protein CBR_g664 [Chara braunii]|eukprot:GBG67533.1 hypothetical protein CBR_g664 [Chara braunii]